ncbi:MAG: LLM class flavin-dependent oxidoreductase [Acidimicrobiales bacterium]
MTAYGLQLPNFSSGKVSDEELFEHVASLASAGQVGGFSSVWVMDHCLPLPDLGGADRPLFEPYTLLGALAARTSTVRLGALVSGVTYRHPSILAKQATTLDVISGGRAILGIGADWYDPEHRASGIDFPPAGERLARLEEADRLEELDHLEWLDRLEEAVQICRAMFTQDNPTFQGRYYAIDDARNLPRPVQAGGVPILIGGSDPRRTLLLVARWADACNVTGPGEQVRDSLAILDRHCQDVGRDPAQVRRTWLGSLFVCPSRSQADALRSELVQAVGPEAVAAMVIGDEGEVAQVVQSLAAEGLDELIFNLPEASGPPDVIATGQVLGAALLT